MKKLLSAAFLATTLAATPSFSQEPELTLSETEKSLLIARKQLEICVQENVTIESVEAVNRVVEFCENAIGVTSNQGQENVNNILDKFGFHRYGQVIDEFYSDVEGDINNWPIPQMPQ